MRIIMSKSFSVASGVLADEQRPDVVVDQAMRRLAVAGGAEAPRAVIGRDDAADLREIACSSSSAARL